jgi:rhomboid protease GluP
MRRITATQAVVSITCVVSLADAVLSYCCALGFAGALEARPSWLVQGEIWRPLTANLVHLYGLLHLTLNMIGLSLAGPAVEAAFRPRLFVALYATSGFLGWVLESTLANGGSGASPAVVGVFAALLVHAHAHRRERYGRRLLVRAIVLSAFWLGSGPVLNGTVVPGLGQIQIADYSHFGGFIAGLIFAIAITVFASAAKHRTPAAVSDSRPRR